MTKKLLLLFCCCLALFTAQAQIEPLETSDSIVTRLVLIGDAGDVMNGSHHPVVETVEKMIPLDKKTTVLFLGDNLYRHGLPDEEAPNYKVKEVILDAQAAIADHTQGQVYFIPGNHDWMNGQGNGFKAIIRQQQYLRAMGKDNLNFLPEDGCPGPETVDLGNDVLLILMDSQWFMHHGDKPGIESDCGTKTEQEVYARIEDIIVNNPKKLILFACHHPFKSNGVHGGYYTWKQHLFPFTDLKHNLWIPLPVLGSIYPISRSVFGAPSDLKFPDYYNMVQSIDAILHTHANVIHLAGHEHNLEWIEDSTNHYIISGAGSRFGRASKSKDSKYIEGNSLGFATLDIYKNKDVRVNFYTVDPDKGGKLVMSGPVLNYSKIPQPKVEDTTSPIEVYKDSALAPASIQYAKTGAVGRFLTGSNYRKEWITPTMFPVLNIKKERGGLTISGVGGGKQTKTLHLTDAEGRQYNLRTIDKNPEKALQPNLRHTIAQIVVRDMISAEHPYGSLVIPPLADAGNVLHSNPKLFYVPDDRAFGVYRKVFANKICMLEEQEPVPAGIKTRSSVKLINKMIEDADNVVDQRAVLRARLLDILIADWDRHFDQWRWAAYDTGQGKVYYPIPRDRDQAFFNSNGVLTYVATHRTLRWMKGFKYKIKDIDWFGRQSRDFDRDFLNRLSERDWQDIAKEYQACVTDTLIHQAVGKMPLAIVAIDGAEMEAKLRARRDALPKAALQYYRFISKKVSILGSNKQEYFTVKGTDTGVLVQVHVLNKKKNGDTTMLTYSRTFDPKVTKEIRLYGFNGADVFDVDESVKQKIRLRIIGGRGADTFNIRGHLHPYVYDLNTEKNLINTQPHIHDRTSDDPNVNDYKIESFQYATTFIPADAGYNTDDGLLFGLGYWHRTYGFRKEPYSTDTRIGALFSFRGNAIQLNYSGTYIGIIKNKYDLVLHAHLKYPDYTYFFGLGNNTQIDNDKNIDFYHARYKHTEDEILIRKVIVGRVSITAGPTFQHYWNDPENNDGKILESPSLVGLDSANVYSAKSYLGARLGVNVNNINNELFPTRGINWQTDFTTMQGLTNLSHPVTTLQSNMTVYASLRDPARFVTVLRLGGGHIFNKDFEYFQALGLGQNNYLRGFRKNRFAGSSMAYGSLEERMKLFDLKSRILPGAVGLVGFDDVGRVWMEGQTSHTWHNAIGGGLYFVPFNMFLLSATVAHSEEETLFNITLGTHINLTF